MAGTLVAHRLNANPRSRKPAEKPNSKLLVMASITINGENFRTLISEGASTQDFIEKVAKENGGGVAKVYYPQFGTHEIVAVKIGNQMLVKNDPGKIAEADFKAFGDPTAVKSAAISASYNSKGGIHFFIGTDGIPIATGDEGSIVMPNACELKISTNICNFSLSVVNNTADPQNMGDLNRMYEKGASPTKSAKDEMAQAHGTFRSEKLMLTDTHVLVLNKDSGEIKTASEFSSKIKPENFKKPELSSQPVAKPDMNAGLVLRTEKEPVLVPLDGSPIFVPYHYIKTFDGSISDAVTVTTHSLPRTYEKKVEGMPEMNREPPNRLRPPEIKLQRILTPEEIKRIRAIPIIPLCLIANKEEHKRQMQAKLQPVQQTERIPPKEQPKPQEKPMPGLQAKPKLQTNVPMPLLYPKQPALQIPPKKKIPNAQHTMQVPLNPQSMDPNLYYYPKKQPELKFSPIQPKARPMPQVLQRKPLVRQKPAEQPRKAKPKKEPKKKEKQKKKIKQKPKKPLEIKEELKKEMKKPKTKKKAKPKSKEKLNKKAKKKVHPKTKKPRASKSKKKPPKKKVRAAKAALKPKPKRKPSNSKKSRKKKIHPYYLNSLLGIFKKSRKAKRRTGRATVRSLG